MSTGETPPTIEEVLLSHVAAEEARRQLYEDLHGLEEALRTGGMNETKFRITPISNALSLTAKLHLIVNASIHPIIGSEPVTVEKPFVADTPDFTELTPITEHAGIAFEKEYQHIPAAQNGGRSGDGYLRLHLSARELFGQMVLIEQLQGDEVVGRFPPEQPPQGF